MNQFEKRVRVELERENPDCKVLRHGWPDFCVVELATGKIRKVVEAKNMDCAVSPEQNECLKALNLSGVAVEVAFPSNERAKVVWPSKDSIAQVTEVTR
jgi:hypothetical protein